MHVRFGVESRNWVIRPQSSRAALKCRHVQVKLCQQIVMAVKGNATVLCRCALLKASTNTGRLDEGDHLGIVEQHNPSIDFVASDFPCIRPAKECPGTNAEPAGTRLGLAEPAPAYPIEFLVPTDK